MIFLRKIIYVTLTAIICVNVLISSDLVRAYNIYPLEEGEKLIEEVILDKDHAEIFTKTDQHYCLKKLSSVA